MSRDFVFGNTLPNISTWYYYFPYNEFERVMPAIFFIIFVEKWFPEFVIFKLLPKLLLFIQKLYKQYRQTI